MSWLNREALKAMSESSKSVKYSIVVPVYNEQESITPFYGRVREVVDNIGRPFEIVFVNDGSSDRTAQVLRELASVDSRVTVVTLRKNSGKSIALGVGFSVARGDYVITMDGDLQHNPAEIPYFIDKLDQGYDIVCGRRMTHEGSYLQRTSTWIANRVLAQLTGINIHDWGVGFKAYKRELLAEVPIYGELQRLIPALALRRGVRVCEVPIHVLPRENGTSKYSVSRKMHVFLDVVTVRFLLRYLARPLHFFGTAGVASIAAGCGIGFWLLYRLLIGVHVMPDHGPALIFAAVLILAGVQLLALGLLAEMQVRHYYQGRSQNAPYEVADILRAESREERISD